MKSFKTYFIGFLAGIALTAVSFYALVPRSTNTFSGKHKIKGDGSSMTYTVQQVEKLEQQWKRDCEKKNKRTRNNKKE